MIVTNSLIYNSIYQRSDRRLNFAALAPNSAKKSVLPVELQARLEKFARQYDFAHQKPVQVRLKRAIDIAGAAMGLVLTSPIMAASAAAIKLESQGRVIFRQKRVGLMGREFDMLKLRSMRDVSDDGAYVSSKNDPRITRVGRFLRRHSLDELPQFWNILRGDMSLVGPRPRTAKENDKLFDADKDSVRRFVVKPGASLDYRHPRNSNVYLKTKEEQAYLDNWSLIEDFRHFLGICRKMFKGENL